MADTDQSADLQQQVEQAAANKTALNIKGSGSKSFLGITNDATSLDLLQHTGVISYEPTELVMTARAGTTLNEINTLLSDHDQSLAFEPPSFGPQATIGGTVACALAGPAKPYLGGTRDYILGCRVLNGQGQSMQFGGEVMKNVAGYDVSRLMTGAMGTLGVMLDLSLKVLPKAEQELTLQASLSCEKAIVEMQQLAGMGLPVTASAYIDDSMFIRLSGSEAVINAAADKLIGDKTDDSNLWQRLREHTLPFFQLPELQQGQQLWRISVPALTEALNINGQWLYDWAGMQRWLVTDVIADQIRSTCAAAGGHATLYRATQQLQREAGVFHPLPAPLLALHKRLKQEFDPQGIFNHQRLFPEF